MPWPVGEVSPVVSYVGWRMFVGVARGNRGECGPYWDEVDLRVKLGCRSVMNVELSCAAQSAMAAARGAGRH